MFFIWWMNRQTVLNPHNGLSNTEEWPTDANNIVGVSQMHDAKWKKQTQKATDHMIPFMWHSATDKTIGRENRHMVGRSWRWGEEMTVKGALRNCWKWWGCSTSWLWGWLQDCINLSALIGLSIKKEWRYLSQHRRKLQMNCYKYTCMNFAIYTYLLQPIVQICAVKPQDTQAICRILRSYRTIPPVSASVGWCSLLGFREYSPSIPLLLPPQHPNT